jgi:type 1 glutamine amidotransferase
MTRRINAHLVCGGWWHDFDYARLQLLQLLMEHPEIRTTVSSDFEDTEARANSEIVIAYTCNVRPSEGAQQALRDWIERGGRLFALHGTNSAIEPPAEAGKGPFTTPRAFPLFADTLGSQFLSHPPIGPYTVTVSPGAAQDPLVAGIEPFDATDELYLSDYHGDLEPLLETRWTGDTGKGFAENEWFTDEPRLVMYRRPIGDGCVLYFTLGHCRSHYDMVAPPFNGMFWPHIERGSWELDEFHTLLRRGIEWAKAPAAEPDPVTQEPDSQEPNSQEVAS